MSSFTHLHVHSRFSVRDALPEPKKLVSYASELGFDAIATTDHGNMGSHYQFADAGKSKGVKIIYGTEGYLCPDVEIRKSEPRMDPVTGKKKMRRPKHNHIVLLAMNDVGYSNILNLQKKAVENFYYEPRFDWNILSEHSEGIICLSACLGGEVAQAILKGDEAGAREIACRYRDLFGDRFFLEVQCHGLEDEVTAYAGVERVGDELGIPIVATNDVHYLKFDDASGHDLVVSMRFSRNEKEGGSGDNRDLALVYKSPEFYLKSADEMAEMFERRPDFLENTRVVTDMCDFTYELNRPVIWPQFDIPEDEREEFETWRAEKVPEQNLKQAYLSREAMKGLKRLGLLKDPVYRERLKYELDTIYDLGCEEYFLVQNMISKWCAQEGVMMGPGRGSGAGSLALYALGITQLDPIKFGLLFERFLNAGRGPQFDHAMPILEEVVEIDPELEEVEDGSEFFEW